MADEMHDSSTASDLNDSLIALPAFKCTICSDLLTAPVMIIDGVANVCGNCYQQDAMPDAIENVALERVLKELTFPCRYKPDGCSEKTTFERLPLHQSKCAFRTFDCPLHEINGCSWKGNSFALLWHFEADHLNCVIRAEGDSVELDVNIAESNRQIKIIVNNSDDLFLVLVRCDAIAQKLWYLVYLVPHGPRKADNFIFVVEQKTEKSPFVFNDKKDVVVGSELDVYKFDKDKAMEINLSVLKQLVDDNNITMSIRVVSKTLFGEALDQKMLSFFECPVCSHYMWPPIVQCLLGHSVCSRCRPKISQCPTCRGNFGSTRNYAMESLSNSVRFPCTYRQVGCKRVHVVTEIVDHETECQLRPYPCVFAEHSECPWRGNLNTIVAHLNKAHPEKTKNTHYYKTSVKFPFNTSFGFTYDRHFYDSYCLMALGEVFWVCHRCNDDHPKGFWTCRYIRPNEDRRNFKYKISICDSTNVNRTLILRGVVEEMTSKDNLLNSSVVVPDCDLGCFTQNGYLTYHIKISKTNEQ